MRQKHPIFLTKFATSPDEFHAAQRLRYQVFVKELGGGGTLVDHANELERDEFDPYFVQTNFSELNQNVAASDRPNQYSQVNNTQRFVIIEHNNVPVDLLKFTWTDADYSQDGSDVVTTLEVVAHDGTVYSSVDNEVSPFIFSESNNEYTVSLPANAFSFEHPEEDLKSGATHTTHTYLFRIKGERL